MSESAPATPEPATDTDSPANSALRWASLTLAFVGLCISGYLAWLSLTGQTAPGCGGGAGCAQVLGSRWSAIGPVPVSGLAVVAYLSALGLLCCRPRSPKRLDLWRTLLGTIGVGLVGAAAWFIVLQAQFIGAWCPYCLAGHGVGAVLGVLLLAPVYRQPARAGLAVVAGLVLTGALVGLQYAVPASNPVVALPSDSDFDLTDATGRHLGLIGGKLRLNAADTPHLGPSDGGDVVVLLLDYGCPHCREAHEMLNQAAGERAGLVVFALPTSLHEDHNPHIALEHERFENSYELALLSLAVWRDAPGRWAEFDRWLFEGNESMGGEYAWPRNLDAAEAYARELIGAVAVAAAYTDTELVGQVERNIGVIGTVLDASPQSVPGLPIAMAPFASGAIYGRFDEERLLDALLDDARNSRE